MTDFVIYTGQAVAAIRTAVTIIDAIRVEAIQIMYSEIVKEGEGDGS